jgi:hypothetical protein
MKYTVLVRSGPGYWFVLCQTDHLQYTTDFAARFADWQIWETRENDSRKLDTKAEWDARIHGAQA